LPSSRRPKRRPLKKLPLRQRRQRPLRRPLPRLRARPSKRILSLTTAPAITPGLFYTRDARVPRSAGTRMPASTMPRSKPQGLFALLNIDLRRLRIPRGSIGPPTTLARPTYACMGLLPRYTRLPSGYLGLPPKYTRQSFWYPQLPQRAPVPPQRPKRRQKTLNRLPLLTEPPIIEIDALTSKTHA